jgi:hypothetical protein
VHHTGLHEGLGPHRGDRLREPFETVADHDAGVGDTAALDLGEVLKPVLGALAAVAGPDSQDVAVPVDADPDDHVERPVGDLPVADLDVDGVDEQHRVHRVQGPVLPLRELFDGVVTRDVVCDGVSG